MKFVLRGKKLLEMSGKENANQVALRARITSSTVYKYLNNPENIQWVDLSILAKLLLDGVAIDRDKLMSLQLGEIFELAEDDD